MRKELPFVLFMVLLFSSASSQPLDSAYAVDPDSLHLPDQKASTDSASRESSGRPSQSDRFNDEVAHSFSPRKEISSEDIDNSISESAGEILQMWSLIDVVRLGSVGQPEIALLGGDTRGVSLFVDEEIFQQQHLYFPQMGSLDLNAVSLSSVSKVRFLPAGLSGLWGRGNGILGADVVTKDFGGGTPYSRATASRGPYGFHRTQVELGRGLTARGKFYFTAEFKESDGHQANSNYDGTSLSGKTSFHLTEQTDLEFSAHRYRTKMGLPFSADAGTSDFRKAVNDWGIGGSLFLKQHENSDWELRFHFDQQNQEVKSQSHGFEVKKIEKTFGLGAVQTLKLKDRHQVRIEGYTERKELGMLGGGRRSSAVSSPLPTSFRRLRG